MSMKAVFGMIFLGLLGLTGIAVWIRPAPAPPGKIPLSWVSDDNPARREQIALFNRLHPKYALRLDPNNTGMAKVIVQSLAGVGPDLFDCYNGYQLSAYVRSGIAWDVTDALEKAGIDITRDVWPAVFPTVLRGGRVYGFPTNAAVNAIWINKDIFDKFHLPYPKGDWTWEQFIPLAQKLTVRDSRGRPRQFGLLCDWWNWKQFILQWGGRIFTKDGTRCIIDSPEAIAGVQFLHDLIYKYRVMPSPVEEASMASAGGWGSGTIHLFAAGKAAMALGGRWWLCTLRGTKGLHLGAAPCPFGPKHVYLGYGRATLINAKSPRRRAAVAFLLYEASKAYNDLVNHQADALAPMKKYCYTPEYMHDPAYPEEDFNGVWLDAMKYGVPEEVSPFINGHRATIILDKQLDLVRNDQKSAAAALHTAAEKINEEIRKTLQMDPVLRRKYEQITKGRLP